MIIGEMAGRGFSWAGNKINGTWADGLNIAVLLMGVSGPPIYRLSDLVDRRHRHRSTQTRQLHHVVPGVRRRRIDWLSSRWLPGPALRRLGAISHLGHLGADCPRSFVARRHRNDRGRGDWRLRIAPLAGLPSDDGCRSVSQADLPTRHRR